LYNNLIKEISKIPRLGDNFFSMDFVDFPIAYPSRAKLDKIVDDDFGSLFGFTKTINYIDENPLPFNVLVYKRDYDRLQNSINDSTKDVDRYANDVATDLWSLFMCRNERFGGENYIVLPCRTFIFVEAESSAPRPDLLKIQTLSFGRLKMKMKKEKTDKGVPSILRTSIIDIPVHFEPEQHWARVFVMNVKNVQFYESEQKPHPLGGQSGMPCIIYVNSCMKINDPCGYVKGDNNGRHSRVGGTVRQYLNFLKQANDGGGSGAYTKDNLPLYLMDSVQQTNGWQCGYFSMMNSMQVYKMYVEKASELKILCPEDLTTFGAKLKLFSLDDVSEVQKILVSLCDHLFKEVKGKVKANQEDDVHNDEDIYPKNDDDVESTKHEKFAGDQTLLVELQKLREEIKVLREENKVVREENVHLSKELEKVSIKAASAGTPKKRVGGGGSRLLKTQPTTVKKLKDNSARKKCAVATNHFEMLQYTTTYADRKQRNILPRTDYIVLCRDEVVDNPSEVSQGLDRREHPRTVVLAPPSIDLDGFVGCLKYALDSAQKAKAASKRSRSGEDTFVFTYDGKEFQKAIHGRIHNGKD
jgi:regulator of replication initiation timing